MPTPRNPNRTALMLDIETLGRTPGSVIFQIGAIRFDPETFLFEDTTFVEICPESCRCHGLTTDPETIAWWQTRNLDPNTLKGTILPKALDTLTSFITSTPEPENIWCNGTSFDFPLLEAAYRATSKTPPWQYWQQRAQQTQHTNHRSLITNH